MKKLLCLLLFCLQAAFAKTSYHSLNVILDWYVNSNHAPLIVAQQQGFFKQEGLNVHLIAPSNPDDGPKFVALSRADIAVNYQPNLMLQVDHGLPVVRIGTLINQPLNALVTLKRSGIKQITDLSHKSIGYSSNAVDRAMLSTMLNSRGLSLNDVKLVNVHYALTQGLMAGRIDAAIGMMRNVEVIEMQQRGYAVNVFYPENYGFPFYDELIFIANRNNINDPDLQKFLIAVQKGVSYLKKHPQKAWQAFAKQYPEQDNAINKKIWFASIKYFDTQPARLNKARYKRLAQYMYQNHLIRTLPILSAYAAS
jgi:putative hydroxymethylpyrimidine transport system substrate-binding protein